MRKLLWLELVNKEQLLAQKPQYLVMATNSELLLLYPSLILFTCPLMPLSLQTNPRDCYHILVFFPSKLQVEQLADCGLHCAWERNIHRPQKTFQRKTTMSFRHSTESMYIWPQAKGESSHSCSSSQVVYDAVLREQSKRSIQG